MLSPFWKINFEPSGNSAHIAEICILRKGPEYLYRLFDVLPKQLTTEMKVVQVQVYIHNNFMMKRKLNLCKT